MSMKKVVLRFLECSRRCPPAISGSVQPVRGYKSTWVAPTLRELNRRKEKQLKKFGAFETPRSKYIEWNHEAEIYAFGKRLGEEFNRDELRKAFTHSSYVAEESDKLRAVGVDSSAVTLNGNEDMVPKGSRIISDTVMQYLKTVLPRVPSEGLRVLHDHVCSQSVLASTANLLGTKDIILSQEYPPSEETLSNTLKAIVSALETSSGITRAQKFVIDFVLVHLAEKDVYEIWDVKNPMGLLCKELESQRRSLPEARIMRETGSSTILGVFQVGLFSDRKLIGKGFGETAEIAEVMAAHDSLRRIYGLQENMLPLPFGEKAAQIVL